MEKKKEERKSKWPPTKIISFMVTFCSSLVDNHFVADATTMQQGNGP
jgi:hypothetical protein